ncbi:MAG: acyl-CoA dehydrogenase family protein [Actinobacteria bacterium]|nr:acyl-CoA dehydrogenase family protein [Actinomycetota bacterium]
MDFRDTPEEASYRADLRAWLSRETPAFWGEVRNRHGYPEPERHREWSRMLHEAGFVGVSWPEEFGGHGRPLSFSAIALEEQARTGAPGHINVIGLGMAGPTIIAHGTPDQKSKYLKPLLTAEEVWCQGFSEPGAGSDLGSLRTRAVRDGDDYVVNGQKVWSSFAHVADRCILLARTDPEAPKHAGISYFLLDMHSDGVETRPLVQITGDPEFNEIFLTDVRIPAESLLGGDGAGWHVAMTTLLHERASLGFALQARLELLFNRLLELARDTGRDDSAATEEPVARDRIAGLYADLQALRFTNYRSLSALLKTGVPGPEGSAIKLHWSLTNQRLTRFALELQGMAALLDGEAAVDDGFWQYQQLRSRGNTIEAGTSEILRNIVAERVMGLPRSAR